MADIGVTSIGVNDRDLSGAVRGQRVGPVPDSSAGVTISAYIANASAGAEFQAAIIATDGTTILAQSAVRTDIGASYSWVQFSGGTLASFDPTGLTFDIVVASESASASIRFDDGASTGGRAGLVTSCNPLVLNGAVGDNSSRLFSIYMTYTEGGGESSTTVTPAQAAVTLNGRTPTTSAFQNVRIREVLVNGSGQAVASATDIGLRVWYSGICAGAPDVSLNGMTTDANGTTSWSIATGSLAFNQPIFYVAQNSVSYSHYACGRLIPNYE